MAIFVRYILSVIQLYCILGANWPKMQGFAQVQNPILRVLPRLCAPRHLQSAQDGTAELVAFGGTDLHQFGLAASASAKLFEAT